MVEFCYLFLGEEESVKKEKIEAIKERYLDKELKDIDFEVVYADNKELSPPRFNEILSYLPSNPSKKRIILIKNIESLKQENRDVLMKYLGNPANSIVLLLDSGKLTIEDPFVKILEPFVKKLNFKRERKPSVFDLTEAIVARKTASALSILKTLLNNRENPESILGALFWQWEKMKDRINLENFRQGLKLLLETDIRIKTGKLKEELALELVVIRLSYLV
ncbi:MAG: hypothetical protein PHS93_01085 [Candidatus Omnitrophica bacterium]|nr:hypothetical protein [Candidatus Omnitrophota bacterium]MDD5351746.1 hypothetical protein [Candidatus Omnitrophota bacterium]MDD5550957.1 hypothetical protein [Candidatus Omnitrophota bacterium]